VVEMNVNRIATENNTICIIVYSWPSVISRLSVVVRLVLPVCIMYQVGIM